MCIIKHAIGIFVDQQNTSTSWIYLHSTIVQLVYQCGRYCVLEACDGVSPMYLQPTDSRLTNSDRSSHTNLRRLAGLAHTIVQVRQQKLKLLVTCEMYSPMNHDADRKTREPFRAARRDDRT